MKKYPEILEVIRNTRNITLPSWGNVAVLNQKNESAASVVTAIDEQVERHLATAFAEIMPEVAYVGEEFGGDRTAKRFWLVDPIDGTGHYVHGLPYCTTMVALIEQGKVTFAAIYDFVNDVMYHAEKGQGAFANDIPIHVSNREINQAYVCYETKLEKPENVQKYLSCEKLCTPLNHVSAGYEYVLVATGKIEGRIGFDPYGVDYDFAPGSLLVTEAGGVVTNIGSREYDFTNPNNIAANPKVHAELTEGENAPFPILK
jgi:myo-inositol-1(or 4)-monophosphatase